MSRQFTELELVRRAKLEKYKEMGVKPYSRHIEHSDDSATLNKK